jgi:ATP-binding cassette subfamily F protein uup
MDKGFTHFEAWRDEIIKLEELDRHKLDRKLVTENHWLVHGVSARRKRNQGRLRALDDLRQQRRDQRQAPEAVKMNVSESEVSGKLVGEAKGLSKSFEDVCVVRNFSMRIKRGDALGLIGPNGSGKTTLLNMLTGTLAPDEGSMRLGVNLEMVLLDQNRKSLDPDCTLSDALNGGGSDMVNVGGKQRHVVSYMKDFLFTPNQARTPVSALSGGERGRLMLARAFSKESNLLVLDEPTNDLDLETLDLLQEMLANYGGTVLLVSHDRDFLDRVVTSVIASEGDGYWVEYAGGYSDMISQGGTFVKRPEIEKKYRRQPKFEQKKEKKHKLSFKEKYSLEKLPKKIAALEVDINKYKEKLARPDFYATDPHGFAKATKKISFIQAEIATAEDEWLNLEILRNETEQE